MGKIIEELKTIVVLAVIAFGGLYAYDYYVRKDNLKAWGDKSNTSAIGMHLQMIEDLCLETNGLTLEYNDERFLYAIYYGKKLSDIKEQKVVKCMIKTMGKYSPNDIGFLVAKGTNNKEFMEFLEFIKQQH